MKRFEPPGLPEQRRGTTPGMVGRYPDFDVLRQADHWDDATRRLVLDRVARVPEIRFFDTREAATLGALCDELSGQAGEGPKIPVLNYVDEKLFEGKLDGYRYFDMPDDRDTWRVVARGLDEEARKLDAESFSLLSPAERRTICHRFARAELYGGSWGTLNVARAFAVLMRQICAQFYAHPWAWNEIGFGGPAYPRGYVRFGSPQLAGGETEAWEGREAYELDPVRDTKERELD